MQDRVVAVLEAALTYAETLYTSPETRRPALCAEFVPRLQRWAGGDELGAARDHCLKIDGELAPVALMAADLLDRGGWGTAVPVATTARSLACAVSQRAAG